MPIRPTDSRPQFFYAEFLQPFHRKIQAMIFEMKPLTDAQFGIEMIQRRFRRAISADQSEIKMTIVSAAFALTMSRRRFPGWRQIHEAVPENPIHFAEQQFRRALQAEHLNFIRAKC